jgi:uncharacterized protein (DUF2336 family)
MPLDIPFRSLARLCRAQAALASHERVRRVLERMAAEYIQKAERLDRQNDPPAEKPVPRYSNGP